MSKRTALIPILVLATATALLFTIKGCWTTWEGGGAEQRTDDAYVRADFTPMSTRVSGTVKKVDVEDYEAVTAGQTLVELDNADYKAILAEAEAALAGAHAALANNQATKQIQDAKVANARTFVDQAESAVAEAKAGVAAAQPDATRAAQELKRQEALLASKASTRQQYEGALADAKRYQGLLDIRDASLRRAEDAHAGSIQTLEAEKRQRTALDTQDGLYNSEIAAKQAAIVVAQVNLGYTQIVAPTAGTAGERHVQVGQLVAPGMEVLDLVQGDVWIQANFKETQLKNLRKGDAAEIKVDTFPGVLLHGKVVEIAPASGSQFALLPPDNATGNYTKVVQRIPVKIALDPDHALKEQLRPGLSVVVSVHASGVNTPSGEQHP